MNLMCINFNTYRPTTPASHRGSERAILYNYSEVHSCNWYWSLFFPWQEQESCCAPACVHLYTCRNTGWPYANTPHFSHSQVLRIFDLQYSIIGHQLNYYWGVIILNFLYRITGMKRMAHNTNMCMWLNNNAVHWEQI